MKTTIKKRSLLIALTALLYVISIPSFSHGLMVSPPSRNATCGMPEDQKPHNATIQACVDAFAVDNQGGYQFMSVLTHDVGRQGVTPLPENVCGFNSETWDNYNNGNTTPWDLPLDWPTTNVSAGAFDITWNISWGPHFDDTEEFVYYITKPEFQYQVGTPLSWDDFEATPFCKQTYDDSSPNGNPSVVPNIAATTFKTSCTLPERSGRHVVYGEWGRNFFTFERFHGCVDVNYSGGGSTNNAPTATPQSASVDQNGSVAITLAGTDSDGTVQSYNVVSGPVNGVVSGIGANRVYTPNVDYSGGDSFTFTVTDNDGTSSATATVTITVNTTGGTTNMAPVASYGYLANDLVVSFDASASSDADNGPSALSYSWDFGDGQSASGEMVSHSYAAEGNYQVVLSVSDGDLVDTESKTVTVTSGNGGGNMASTCEYVVSNQWSNGFVAEIRIMNRGTSAINGWDVSWGYTDGSAISSAWNATLQGTGPYSASSLAWNAVIEPGESAVFGVQGTHNGIASSVDVTGDVCN